MNKKELVEKMAIKTGMTKKNTETCLEALLESVQISLLEEEKVQLVGFGTFRVQERSARQGRNPRDPQQTIEIRASKASVFKAGKELKEKVNA